MTTIYFKIEKVDEEQVKPMVKGVQKFIKDNFPKMYVWIKEETQ